MPVVSSSCLSVPHPKQAILVQGAQPGGIPVKWNNNLSVLDSTKGSHRKSIRITRHSAYPGTQPSISIEVTVTGGPCTRHRVHTPSTYNRVARSTKQPSRMAFLLPPRDDTRPQRSRVPLHGPTILPAARSVAPPTKGNRLQAKGNPPAHC